MGGTRRAARAWVRAATASAERPSLGRSALAARALRALAGHRRGGAVVAEAGYRLAVCRSLRARSAWGQPGARASAWSNSRAASSKRPRRA